MYDFQKADLWKRISALLFDLILLMIVVVGAAFLLSALLGYSGMSDELASIRDGYAQSAHVDFEISSAEYNALSEADKKIYDDAYAAFAKDPQAGKLYGLLINLTFVIVTFSVLIGYLLLEFTVPLLFGNGQTLGKKIFGIGVMREDGVRVSPLLLFVRTLLGKYTVETMVPVMVVLMILFGAIGIEGTLLLIALVALQIILVFTGKGRAPIHDRIAHTVTVDMASQRIFDSPEELLAYKQKLHQEMADSAKY